MYLIQAVDTNSYTSSQTVQIQISWLLKKPTDLDLHCLQRQSISGFSRTRVNLGVIGANLTLGKLCTNSVYTEKKTGMLSFSQRKLTFHCNTVNTQESNIFEAVHLSQLIPYRSLNLGVKGSHLILGELLTSAENMDKKT